MKFQKLIEERKEELIHDLQECIRIPSVYKEDDSEYPYGLEVQRALEYMLSLAGSMGFRTYNMDNQVGFCEYGEGEEMIAVLGHLDVVPEGDGWSKPPFEGIIEDGRIYGRGTMDDKGPTMAALYGLLAIKESGLPLNRRIRILFGVNEETGSADMKYYVGHGGEVPVMGFTPDGEYPVINGEKGLVNEAYRFEFVKKAALQANECRAETTQSLTKTNESRAETTENLKSTEEIQTKASEGQAEITESQIDAKEIRVKIKETQTWKESTDPNNVLHLKEIWGGTAHNIVPNQAWAVFTCSKALAQEILQMQAEKITCEETADGIKIEAEGVNAHGGTPWEGENAIGRLVQFLAKLPLEEEAAKALTFLSERLGMECDGSALGIAMKDEVSGMLTMNLGTIRGKEDGLEVKLNYRYPVTKSFADCGPVVKAAFEEAGFVQSEAGHKACLYMPPESELVQKLMKVYEDYTGEKAEPKSIGGGTYAKMLPNVLAFGPIFPGDEVREHKPDEFMEISRLMDNVNILAEAMYALACE